MRGALTLAALTLFACAALAPAAPAPELSPKPKEECPWEIDFSPLGATDPNQPGYRLRFSARSKGGEVFDRTYTSTGKISPGAALAFVREEFEEAGWQVKSGLGDVLIVEAYKGSPVVSLEVRAEGLPKEQAPTVRRLPQEKEKK